VHVSVHATAPAPARRGPHAAPPSRFASGPSVSDAAYDPSSTASTIIGLGGALWLVLCVARPLEAGPALFYSWVLLGALLPGVAMLVALSGRLRGVTDMRPGALVGTAAAGGALALFLARSAQGALNGLAPSLRHGFGWLVSDVLVTEGALVLTSLALVGAVTRGRVSVRSAMFVAGGIGVVFSSLRLLGELTEAIAAGHAVAPLSAHVVQHALLLPFGAPLATALIAGGIIRSRRDSSPVFRTRLTALAAGVLAAQATLLLLAEVVPAASGGGQLVCLALALGVGAALTVPFRRLAEHGVDDHPARLADPKPASSVS